MNPLIDSLRATLGATHVLTDPFDIAPYCTDWRGRYSGQPLCVVKPADAAEVAAVVQYCNAAGVAIVPQGGNTGLCGGATPLGPARQPGGEVIVSLTRLNHVRAIDPANNTLTVEAGCTLASVKDAAAAAGRLFPLSLAAEGTATIGGNLATNAGGVQVLRYGNARELCLGLEVVLPDGRLWDGLCGLRKNNTGYDLKQLFIGAEGTLGLITAAVLKLFPQPTHSATAWVAVPEPAAAVALLSLLREQLGDRVTAFELIGRPALDLVLKHLPDSRDPLVNRPPWQVLVEIVDTLQPNLADTLGKALESALATGIEAGHANDATIAQSLSQARALWALREGIPTAQKIEGLSIKHDISVPISRLPEFIARADAALIAAFPGIRIVCFGHLGDGNLHYNPSNPTAADNAAFIAQTATVNRIVHDIANDLGGSISAEHGIGQLKRAELLRYKSEVEMDMMRALKQALDPQHLMNPGKIF
ncbi:MAG: FAD-binding oxidoreductase [Gammaproteobacteria bacterium]|nr:FAD-binding oxidoreductase [Rhodocyclaceae bacterium]MBU3909570.1 FAD-binding oxidoreductase [Gammaproteobacteria bacterium]MBU3990745.1 FAD-binding oxidoreductase [Gammaproteobacteria bacterium]MBU4003233.1 FAD-binding oxidoreductase [Gammaproteobacteria bacterium]MBU4022282.1 FAD-binding oxidoreductase [Gammaproteobacteria bacterium]